MQRRRSAAVGSVLFLVVVPGTLAVLVPWWLTGWQVQTPAAHWAPIRLLGAILCLVGGAVLLHSFVRFVMEGVGTPAPIAPTQRLVVTGAYRYVRNPMYLAVTAVIVGQALLLGALWLLIYGLGFVVVTASFVHWYEEPKLVQQFPRDYPTYRAHVRGWVPRLRPWAAPSTEVAAG